MRKVLIVAIAATLAVVFAMPASAEVKLNGFYRVVPVVSNFMGGAGNSQLNSPGTVAASSISLTKEASTGVDTSRSRAVTQMRNRLRFEVGDENVKGVTFFEIDGSFGDAGGVVGRNQGFASNGDSINLETKNVYLWFKIPNTPVSFQVGLQGYSDEFAGLLFSGSDQAGVVANIKLAPVNIRLAGLKLRDHAPVNATPANNAYGGVLPGDFDADYYTVDAKFSPVKEATVTGHFGFLRDSGGFNARPTEATGLGIMKAYYLGANATFNAGPAAVTGFLLYNFGKFESDGGTAPGVDIAGYAASLRADAKLGPGKGFLEGLYVSGDNDPASTTKYKSIVTGSDFANLTSWYGRPDLWILFPNFDMIQAATALVLNPNNSGRGLMLFAAGYTQKLGDRLTGKVGAGYLEAAQKRPASVATEAKGKNMGTEINANVTYNITKGLDFGVHGAYCFLGSFYDRVAPQQNPDDLYSLFTRLNYAF